MIHKASERASERLRVYEWVSVYSIRSVSKCCSFGYRLPLTHTHKHSLVFLRIPTKKVFSILMRISECCGTKNGTSTIQNMIIQHELWSKWKKNKTLCVLLRMVEMQTHAHIRARTSTHRMLVPFSIRFDGAIDTHRGYPCMGTKCHTFACVCESKILWIVRFEWGCRMDMYCQCYTHTAAETNTRAHHFSSTHINGGLARQMTHSHTSSANMNFRHTNSHTGATSTCTHLRLCASHSLCVCVWVVVCASAESE